ncbi:Scr1 family TA system antitoxin-like transcriptional regulator [Amycolatopsis nigrescens]|uniref:Scr1 family TA system antitoxin-like transcriptional regulator n=1 Tax=Amycolatopsis nigrescens TaxID=381445 RepID=UPI00037E89E3|nr:Scr1 family TA system antitoxin-like transcriptional regulator [Amycolatopsis nigrescens]
MNHSRRAGQERGYRSSARARELGDALTQVREKAELTADSLAKSLSWSPSKISRMESGKRGSSEMDVAIYAVKCGAPRPELERLRQLARETDAEYRLQAHGRDLPDNLRSLIRLENTADAIINYDLVSIPGLLQTEDYVRALLGMSKQMSEGQFEPRVLARLS